MYISFLDYRALGVGLRESIEEKGNKGQVNVRTTSVSLGQVIL